MQRAAGLYGSIIVSLPEGVSEPFSYDYDQNIILNDWYHASTNEQAAGLSAIPFVFVGEPQVNSIKSKLISALVCLELAIKCSTVPWAADGDFMVTISLHFCYPVTSYKWKGKIQLLSFHCFRVCGWSLQHNKS